MRCWKNTSLLQQLRQQARCCLPIVVQKTPSLNLRQICRQLLVLCYVLAAQLLLPSALAQESRGAEIRQLQVRQAKEGLLLNASIASTCVAIERFAACTVPCGSDTAFA